MGCCCQASPFHLGSKKTLHLKSARLQQLGVQKLVVPESSEPQHLGIQKPVVPVSSELQHLGVQRSVVPEIVFLAVGGFSGSCLSRLEKAFESYFGRCWLQDSVCWAILGDTCTRKAN
jgi:hypothetical protein